MTSGPRTIVLTFAGAASVVTGTELVAQRGG
jgi:hypothetical protein